MTQVTRIQCPECGAECMEQEVNCWQCGAPLRSPAAEQPPKPAPTNEPGSLLARFRRRKAEPAPETPAEPPIQFDALFENQKSDAEASATEGEASAQKRMRVTLTGEVLEEEVSPAASSVESRLPAGPDQPEPEKPIFVLAFCKNCGFQNPEGVRECQRCKSELEVVHEPPPPIEDLPRAWGFDVLGVAWILLGLSAVLSGIFLLKTDPTQHGADWSDYFWTLIVVVAPGIMIFMRHWSCKILFWVMSLGSLLIWLVIGFIWLYVGLHVTPNGEVALGWFALLSLLSAISWFTVRYNDEFDMPL